MAHILIVDDDQLLRDVLHKTLVRAGYTVEDAADGVAALQSYRRQASDVVITDIVMPNKEGLGTIRELRRLDANARIIAMSGGGLGKGDNYLYMAQKLGANRILAKPFSVGEIVAAVAEVLAETKERAS